MQVVQPQKSGGQLFTEAFNPYIQMIIAQKMKEAAENRQTKRSQEALTPSTQEIQSAATQKYGQPFQTGGLPPEIAKQRVAQKAGIAQQKMGMPQVIPEAIKKQLALFGNLPEGVKASSKIPGTDITLSSKEKDWASEYYKQQTLGGPPVNSKATFLQQNPQFKEEDLEETPVYSTSKGRKIKTGTDVKVNQKRYENRIAMEDADATVQDLTRDALNTVTEVETGVKNFGLTGHLPSIPGTKRVRWEANINKLLSGKIIDLMTQMKQASKTGATGFGQLSNKELDVLRQASTSLNRGLSSEDAQVELTKIKAKLQKILSGKGEMSGQTSTGMGYTVGE